MGTEEWLEDKQEVSPQENTFSPYLSLPTTTAPLQVGGEGHGYRWDGRCNWSLVTPVEGVKQEKSDGLHSPPLTGDGLLHPLRTEISPSPS